MTVCGNTCASSAKKRKKNSSKNLSMKLALNNYFTAINFIDFKLNPPATKYKRSTCRPAANDMF